MPGQDVRLWVALLRGINVGGHGKLSMAQLRGIVSGLGFSAVQTYLQSGNLVFESSASQTRADLAASLGSAIEAAAGFHPDVFLLGQDDLTQLIAACPYGAEGLAKGASVHVFVMDQAPQPPVIAAVEALKASDEAISWQGHWLYLHAPSGVGRSKLAERAPRLLGGSVTARNWNTVLALAALTGVAQA